MGSDDSPITDAPTGHVGAGMGEQCDRCGQAGEWLRGCIDEGGRGETEVYHGFDPGRLCRGCHMDLLPDPEVLYTELLDHEFTFYYGAASGSARKALRKMEESHVMVSYATQNNSRIRDDEVHFTDCGGAPDSFKDGAMSETGDYPTSDAKYLEYVDEIDADLWSLRDYPCEADVLDAHDRTVADHQQMTIDRHRDLLELAADEGVNGQPVSILQGQHVSDYLAHLDAHREAGTLTDYVGIGSICRRNAEDEIQEILCTVREELPARYRIHAFGVKLPVLERAGVLDALASADSCAYDYGLMMEAIYGDARYTWKAICEEYLAFKRDVGERVDSYADLGQQSLGDYDTEVVSNV